MSILILKNVSSEGPGTIEDHLRTAGIDYRIVDLSAESFPDDAGFDTLVLLGGPMSVNEEDIYPYLTREIGLARKFMLEGRKVLGICLGAQIMAKALGSKVYRGPEKETGWIDIELSESGMRDRIMTKTAIHPRAGDFWRKFKVFHWHGETFDIPGGCERLAGSSLYPNQAFRYGANAYALQFHMEVTKDMIFDWLKDEQVDIGELRRLTDFYYDDYHGRALSFYRAFF